MTPAKWVNPKLPPGCASETDEVHCKRNKEEGSSHIRHTSEEFKERAKVKWQIVNFVRKNRKLRAGNCRRKTWQENMPGGHRNTLPFFLSTLHSLSTPISLMFRDVFFSSWKTSLIENFPKILQEKWICNNVVTWNLKLKRTNSCCTAKCVWLHEHGKRPNSRQMLIWYTRSNSNPNSNFRVLHSWVEASSLTHIQPCCDYRRLAVPRLLQFL